MKLYKKLNYIEYMLLLKVYYYIYMYFEEELLTLILNTYKQN